MRAIFRFAEPWSQTTATQFTHRGHPPGTAKHPTPDDVPLMSQRRRGDIMGANKLTARIAGVIYLLFVFVGIFSLMYVAGKVTAKGNAAETAANLLAHQTLIRIDLAVGLISTLIFLLAAFTLYQLLKDTNRQHALLMLILVLVQLPTGYVSKLLQYGALELVRGAGILSSVDQTSRETLAMVFVHLNSKGLVLSEFFWGVWLFPLAVLVYRSGFLPRFVGVWLFINGIAYIVMCMMNLFVPQYTDAVFKIAFPAMLGEVALTVALLYTGFRSKAFSESPRAA